MSEVISNNPVSFSTSAKEELIKIQSETPEKYIRVGVKGGGCTGLSYVLEMDEKQDDDSVFEDEGVRFIMKKAHGIYLQDMKVDYSSGLNARGFTFTNPNASETCGCGQSFAV